MDWTEFGKIICNEPRDGYLSRVATVGAGVPETAPTLTLNRLCGSGPQVVVSATDIMIGALTGPVGHVHMCETAQNIAEACEIGRETQAYALESDCRAVAAIDAGRFDDQIVPITVRDGRKETVFLKDGSVTPKYWTGRDRAFPERFRSRRVAWHFR